MTLRATHEGDRTALGFSAIFFRVRESGASMTSIVRGQREVKDSRDALEVRSGGRTLKLGHQVSHGDSSACGPAISFVHALQQVQLGR